MMKTTISRLSRPLGRRTLGSRICARGIHCCTLAMVVLLCTMPLGAQSPIGDSADSSPPSAAPSETVSPPTNLPEVPQFDIDLGTEEFEDFGEENFQVEEKPSRLTEIAVIVIKIILVVVVALLLGMILRKLFRPRGPRVS